MTTVNQQLDDAAELVVVNPDSRGRAISESKLAKHQRRELFLYGGAYLVLSVFVWWNVWTSDPRTVTTCGCGDSAGAIWVMEWPAYAIAHGFSPFYSTVMNHPAGINLLANAGVLAISLPLVPLTWLFGPIASLNVAFTLAPVLSALAMFLLLRRWVSWTPAAFVGGLVYGFCPFLLVSSTLGWINIGMAVVPPLIVLCLDELLYRRRHRSGRVGVVLGLLVVLQFFISTEVLLIVAISAACGVLLVFVYTRGKYRESFANSVRHALVGLGAAAVTIVLLLAYPAWFATAGPGHFNGLLWPNGIPSYNNNELQYFVRPPPLNFFRTFFWQLYGGYQGKFVSFQYFGAGMIIVLVLGVVVWRHDRRLWFFGTITALSGALSLAHYDSLPLLENLIPSRFVLITYLSVAVLLSLIVDHTNRSVSRLLVTRGSKLKVAVRSRCHIPPRLVAGMAAVIVAAIAVVPPATYLASALPITTQRVALPTWFRLIAPHLQGRQVLLVFPTYFAEGDESPISWQAVDGNGMSYSLVNGVGSEGSLFRAGKERPGASVIARTEEGTENLRARGIRAVRKALVDWGVTLIVIPDESNLPPYDRTPSVLAAAALMTAATGERPIHQADAWIWSAVRFAPSAAQISVAQVRECTLGVPTREVLTVEVTTACVLKSATS